MKIAIYPEITDPEVNAMLQAFYSRSHTPIEQRIKESGEQPDQIKQTLKKYYIGFGHKSIGDCGFTTIWIEDVSILCCKIIQNFPLYNGIEKSTRYIDFSHQDFSQFSPTDQVLLKNWLHFYETTQSALYQQLVKKKKPKGMSDNQFDNAMKAHSFDLTRGFLPCASKTSFSWTGSLSSIQQRCNELYNHPIKEVRDTIRGVLDLCMGLYPNSFSTRHIEVYDASQDNLEIDPFLSTDFSLLRKSKKLNQLLENMLINRQPLSKVTDHYGTITVSGSLDFGSFRDLQRHRNGTMSLVSFNPALGFHPFYVKSLQKAGKDLTDFNEHIFNFVKRVMSDDPISCSFLYPLGWVYPFKYTGSLRQWLYIIKLRTNPSVHPILRQLMLRIGSQFERELGIQLGLSHLDANVNLDRGLQTILETKD